MLLKKGMKGRTVLALQGRINETGLTLPLTLDGDFGRGTHNGVCDVQRALFLTEDGIAGPVTLAALQALAMGSQVGPVRPLRRIEIDLANHIGRTIADYCPHKTRTSDADPHCAHWITHLLGWPKPNDCAGGGRSVTTFGAACSGWRRFDPTGGLSLPSNEACLAYVAQWDKNTKEPIYPDKGGMVLRRPRHIGVFLNGYFYHYENGSRYEQVVKVSMNERRAPHRFVDRYRSAGQNESPVWLSKMPPGVMARVFDSGRAGG